MRISKLRRPTLDEQLELMWFYEVALVPLFMSLDPDEHELNRVGEPVLVDGSNVKLLYRALLSCEGVDLGVRKAAMRALGRKFRKSQVEMRRVKTKAVLRQVSQIRALDGHIDPETGELYTYEDLTARIKAVREAARISADALRQRKLRLKQDTKL